MDLNQVLELTRFTKAELNDLISKDLFPDYEGISQGEKIWSFDDIQIWIQKNEN